MQRCVCIKYRVQNYGAIVTLRFWIGLSRAKWLHICSGGVYTYGGNLWGGVS
jgi:hypothetical protein